MCVPRPDELSVMTYLGYYCNRESPGKNSLLDWIHEKIPHRNVSNFTTDWKDGVALACLADVVSGGQFPDYEDMTPDDPLTNATKSMEFAETLGVPKTMSPEDFVDPTLDPLPLMTYLLYFKNATPSGDPLAGISAAGPGLSGDKAQKETNFVVRGRIPDWAPLDVAITAPDGSKLNHQRTQTVATSTVIKYTPQMPGTYVVEVKVNHEHIKGSPFTAHHKEPSNAKACTAAGSGLEKALVGEKSEFTVDCSAGGTGSLQVEVTGPNGRIGTEIAETSDRAYIVKTVPTEAGPHVVAVNWSGNHISGSPFTTNAVDPKKCLASGAGLSSGVVGEPATFKVQTKNAGQGILEVDVTGPDGDTVPVKKREDSPDEHVCSFVPNKKGNHSIKLTWAGFPVGSPFKMAATVSSDPTKCTVRDVPTGRIRAGKEAKFIVDTTEAGEADLHASGKGVSLPQECSIRPLESGVYEVSFTPFEVGKLDIKATYGGSDIPNMPLSFTVNDPTKCHINAAAIEKGTYSLKQPISFRVSAQYAGEGTVSARLHSPTGETDADVREVSDGTYQIQFEPTAPGPHGISIFFDEEQIPNGLVRLFIEAGSGADDVIITQPAPSKMGVFFVDTHYDYQVNAAGAKQGDLAATGNGIRTGSKPKVDIADKGDGQYSVSVATEVPDEYHIVITWGGDAVPGSPFTISTVDSAHANKVKVDGPHYTVGELPVSLTANTSNAGAGKLAAQCHGQREGSVPVTVEEGETNNYNVSFTSPKHDSYILSVLYSDEHVPGSPFKINNIPPDASKVKVTRPSGKGEPFTVDTSEAGVGQLSGSCKGRKVNETPVTITETEPDVYAVNFDCPQPDIYTLDIQWGGESVPDSPFELNLYPTDAGKVKVSKPDSYSAPSVHFDADASEAGVGALSATCTGRKAGSVPIAVKQVQPFQYTVDADNLDQDVYAIGIKYDGKDVPDSPFKANLYPTDASKVVLTTPAKGKKDPIEADTSMAGIGKLTSTCTGKDTGRVPVSIDEVDPDKHTLSFNPPQPDIYTMNVLWDGENVPGSPMEMNLYPTNADKVKIAKPTSYSLPRAQFKADTSAAGEGQLTANCTGKKTGPAKVNVQAKGPHIYEIDVDDLQPDFYNVEILYDDIGVPGSPFPINLIPTDAAKVIVTPPSDTLSVSMRAHYKVDASEAGEGELTAFCRAESSSNLPVEVTQLNKEEEQYKVSVTPIKEDKYHLSIQWNQRDVPNSPFELNLVPPTFADRVVVGDPQFKAVGEPVNVAVDTSRAGPGKLTAQCEGKSVGIVSVDVSDDNLSFTPTQPDEYSLAIFYNDIAVPRSPLSIAAKPISETADFVIQKDVENVMEFDFSAAPNATPPEPSRDELEMELGDPLMIDLTVPEDGRVLATAKGDTTGPAAVSVQKSDEDNSYHLEFNPIKPDRYTIDVTHDGNAAPNSPVIVNYKSKYDGSKCAFTGLDKIPFHPMIDVPIMFGVDATEAGKGDLRVTSNGPSGDTPSTIKVVEDVNDKGTYHVTYVPTAPGDHRLHAHWVDDGIAGSPLMFKVVSGSAITGDQVYPFGKPVVLTLTADCKAKNLDAHAVMQGTNMHSKLKVSKGQNKGTFALSFQPSTPGNYDVFVKLNDNNVAGSPYRIRYADPPNPQKVKVTRDPTDVGYINDPVTFTIDTTNAGTSDLILRPNVRKKAKDKRKAPDFKVTDNEDGTYTATFVPIHPAQHHFEILYAGEHVPGSPFPLLVKLKPPSVSHILSSNLNLILVGKPVDVYFKLDEDDNARSISATATGLHTDDAEVKVQSLEGEREYRAHFIPTNPDDYQVEVLHDKRHVQGSPFPIKVVGLGGFEQNKATADIENPPVTPAGKPFNLLLPIDYSTAAEDVIATVNGPEEIEESPEVRNDKKGSYGVVYTPPKAGEYLVNVKKNGSDLNGSPFRILVKESRSDASKCFVVDEDKALFQKPLKFGKPANFRISTSEAGPGTLNITSRGPGRADVRIFDNNNGTYTCEFSPSVAGKYHVDILWDDQHISGSPYELNFREKKKKVITGLDLDLNNFRVGVPHRFKLHCEEIGSGKLELAIKPPSAAEITVSDLGSDSYQVQIHPVEEGHHELSVKYGNNHIFGSPYTVTFNHKGDASKCRMISSEVEQSDDGKDHVVFIVSVEGAGNGKLTSHVDNPQSGERQPVVIDTLPDEPFTHKVHFDLGEGTEYQLVIKYDGEHIEGSPFKLLFADEVDASVCQAEGDGLTASVVDREASFVVNTEGAGEGSVSVTIKAEDGLEIGTQISKESESEYKVTYTPTRPGNYIVSVTFSEQDITNSPFAMKSYMPLHSSNLFVNDPVTEGYIGIPFQFNVETREDMNEEGEVTIKAKSRKTEVTGTTEKVGEGKYKCSVEPVITGRYEVKIMLNGENITGSPFKIKVSEPPKPENVIVKGPGILDGCVGQEGNFSIETENAGTGTMSVRLHGPKGAFKINMRRHPENERTILVRYDPKYVGEYKIDITWSDVHVPGSPFTVNIKEQHEALVEAEVEENGTD